MSEDPIVKYTALLAKNPNNDLARFSLGKALYEAGRFAEAAGMFRACMQRKPDWMVPAILLGRCEIQLGNRTAAKEHLNKARQLAIDQHHDGPLLEVDELLAAL